MKKKILALTIAAGIMVSGTVSASPVQDFSKGALEVEFGSTLGSEVSGKGKLNPSADGKKGFKYGAVWGLGDNLAIQVKGGKFQSEDTTVTLTPPDVPFNVPIHSHAKSDIKEINLVYQLNDNFSASIGYIENKIWYGSGAVRKEKPSTIHFGLAAHKDIDTKLNVFSGVMAGQDVLFWEAGIGYKLTQDTTLNVAYGERYFKNVPLHIDLSALTLPPFEDILDYKMKGVTFMVSHKFR